MQTFSFRDDDSIKEELDFIKATLHSNQSKAIKNAIHAYYLHLKEQEQLKKSPQEILKQTGFIGCFSGPKDLSTNYKQILTKELKKKHGLN